MTVLSCPNTNRLMAAQAATHSGLVKTSMLDSMGLDSFFHRMSCCTKAVPKQKCRKDDLYVLQYSHDKTSCKVGRSSNVTKRKRALEASHNFRINIIAIFPGAGYLEPVVHSRLTTCRSQKGAGKEWYALNGAQAVDAVNKVLQEASWLSSGTASTGAASLSHSPLQNNN